MAQAPEGVIALVIPAHLHFCIHSGDIWLAASRRGQLIELTAIEFRLLSVFIRSRSRVLTREQLLADAWAPDTFASDRVVDNHIANLRKKIERDPLHPAIIPQGARSWLSV